MRQRPWPLYIFAFALWGQALSFPLQLAWIYEVPLTEFAELWRLLSNLNVATMALMIITGFAAFKVSRATLVLVPITAAVVIFNNWWVGYVGTTYSLWQTGLASLAFLALSILPLQGKSLAVLKNPALRWWRVAQRVQMRAPVLILDSPLNLDDLDWLSGPDPLRATTFDMSKSGAFLQVPKKVHMSLEVGDEMQLKIQLSEDREMFRRARVVRKASARGSYPDGIGVQFL